MKNFPMFYLPAISTYVCIFFLPAFFLGFLGKTQNLIPNNGFETYSPCPVAFGQLSRATGWQNPSSTATPDFFHTCATQASNVKPPNTSMGYQYPRIGNGMGGIVTLDGTFCLPCCPALSGLPDNNYREYLQIQLSSPLTAGVTYDAGVYIICANKVKYATDRVGMYFSSTPPNWNSFTVLCASDCINEPACYAPLPYTPQIENTAGNYITDTINWTYIGGTFVAAGGEQWLTIGNFRNDASTGYLVVNYPGFVYDIAYYFIDDVCIKDASIGSCITPLPVQLTSLNAHCEENEIILNWTTFSETNNDYFSVEYSEDGKIFTERGIVKGAGNSSTLRIYEFTDANPPFSEGGVGDVVYYRLKQTDNNGSYEYSPVVSVKLPCSENEIVISPNPSTGIFSVINLPENAEVQVYDIVGRKIFSEQSKEESLLIDLAEQPAGIYLIEVNSLEKGNRFCQKIIISSGY